MSYRSSTQTRAFSPEGEEALHPDAIRMAEIMREAKEAHGACLFRDLTRAGFTAAQITEHHPMAERIATETSVVLLHRQGGHVDRCADILIKARTPWPNRPPMMAGSDAVEVRDAWGRYCQARSALQLDPWSGQRERALVQLAACLDVLPIMPADRARILHETGQLLANTPQGSFFAMRGTPVNRVPA